MLKVLGALRNLAKRQPNDTALIEGDRRVSYAQLDAMVDAVALQVADGPTVIAILAPNGVPWVAGWLGLARAGKTIVSLPPFFSSQQLAHIVSDSQTGLILSVDPLVPMAEGLGQPVLQVEDMMAVDAGERLDEARGRESRHIVYTSGTTGTPKGVRLGAAQVDWSAQALKRAVAAGPQDHYLSVLPFPLLLEQICGICVPLLAGATVTIASDVAAALMMGNPAVLVEAVNRVRPTITVVVPEFLTAWVTALQMSKSEVPETLRYVAVGGAPIAPALARKAHDLGIPVHEGYGLSECCSVVALNRPGNRVAHTVGKPLDGLQVLIEDGEIVVSGPSVMEGYLHREDISGGWKTGDLGRLDEQGNLVVEGRKDRLLILSNGRNVNPEWVEAMVKADPRIAGCVASGHGEAQIRVEIAPSGPGADWFNGATDEHIGALIQELCKDAPDYARPGSFTITTKI